MSNYITRGIRRMKGNPKLLLVLGAFVSFMAVITPLLESLLNCLGEPFGSAFYKIVLQIIMFELTVFGLIGIVQEFGKPTRAEKRLMAVGLKDRFGQAPLLLSKKKDGKKYTYKFFSPTIPVQKFEDYRAEIETALNLSIIQVKSGKSPQQVILYAIDGKNVKQEILRWTDAYMSEKDFEIVLGESYSGVEILDLVKYPHVMLGGGTGSGKTNLLKLILIQAIKKGAVVFLIDLKGGVDFPSEWQTNCSLITRLTEIDHALETVCSFIDERSKLLYDSKTTSIEKYNAKAEVPLKRIIVACDEIAEVLDKTGLSKEEKDIANRIEGRLSTIARMGRAFGIHLILCTQRPSADLISGQIRNNLGFKICGRADKNLGQIILDNSIIVDNSLPTEQGMFLTNAGVLFQAYFIDEDIQG